FGHPRSNLPPAGTLRLHYSIGGDTEPTGLPPRFLRRWFNRIAPVLASAAGRVYRNDDTPLVEKLPKTVNLLLRQINLLDLLAGAGFALAAGICGGTLAAMSRFLEMIRPRRRGRLPKGIYPRYALAASRAGDLTIALAPAAQQWEAR